MQICSTNSCLGTNHTGTRNIYIPIGIWTAQAILDKVSHDLSYSRSGVDEHVPSITDRVGDLLYLH